MAGFSSSAALSICWSGVRWGSTGSASGSATNCCSARRCNTSRLVTSSFTPGHASNSAARSGAAAMTCSKLSSTSSIRRSCSALARSVRVGRAPGSRSPSASVRAGSTSSRSFSAARETNCTPSANASTSSAATCSARRVLPTPALPVKVSRCISGRWSSAHIARTSCSRPIRGVAGMGSWRLLTGGR